MKGTFISIGLALCIIGITDASMITVGFGQQQQEQQQQEQQINVTELNTLDRMRYTAIQMTIIDLQNNQSLNMTDNEIASKIFMLTNSTPERPTTLEIEQMYANVTQQNPN